MLFTNAVDCGDTHLTSMLHAPALPMSDTSFEPELFSAAPVIRWCDRRGIVSVTPSSLASAGAANSIVATLPSIVGDQ